MREKQLAGKLKRVFALMDVDGDGKVSLDDLISITEQLGYKIKPVRLSFRVVPFLQCGILLAMLGERKVV